MSVTEIELGRSAVNNIKNNTWDVYPSYKLYEEDGRALVSYVKSLEEKAKKLDEIERGDY